MNFSTKFNERAAEIAALFGRTFATSEGPQEGQLIGRLAQDLIATTPAGQLTVASAIEDEVVVGSIVFTQLRFSDDLRQVQILSPVAVAPEWQGQGVGTSLLEYGLRVLREQGVDAVFTYGDPNYYARVGFYPVATSFAQPPYELSHPHGWLAQSMKGDRLAPFAGPSQCVPGLSDPKYW